VRGFETYFLSEARTSEARDVAARENESVRYEAGAASDAADPLRFIVSDLAQNEYLRVSQRLAQAVQRRLGRVHPAPSRGVQQAGFKVLVTASMPAVLVEVGYGSNAADAAYITGAAGQRAIAEAIADATVEHLARYGGARGATAWERP
jgi:N-acetylmuramoyl-L-alanine amidase